MLLYLLYSLFILACLILIAAVLLQPGKADAGALFTSNISSTAFGPRGTQSVLAKITIGAAASFMVAAFLLSQPALTGTRSVLETTAAPADSPAPASTPAVAEQTGAGATDANANTAIVVPAASLETTANNAGAATASPAANNQR